jgi:hypothetical protein
MVHEATALACALALSCDVATSRDCCCEWLETGQCARQPARTRHTRRKELRVPPGRRLRTSFLPSLCSAPALLPCCGRPVAPACSHPLHLFLRHNVSDRPGTRRVRTSSTIRVADGSVAFIIRSGGAGRHHAVRPVQYSTYIHTYLTVSPARCCHVRLIVDRRHCEPPSTSSIFAANAKAYSPRKSLAIRVEAPAQQQCLSLSTSRRHLACSVNRRHHCSSAWSLNCVTLALGLSL